MNCKEIQIFSHRTTAQKLDQYSDLELGKKGEKPLRARNNIRDPQGSSKGKSFSCFYATKTKLH